MNLLLATLLAYHSASLFEESAAEGGGGGVLYTGSPLYEGYDCSVCHIDPPGDATIRTGSEPLSLLTEREYVPGEIYDFTLMLDGETKGKGTKGNYNAIALEILDQDLQRVGGFFGYDADVMTTLADDGALFSRGGRNEVMWTFRWQAPEEGTGYVDFYLVAVDGDGAGDLEMTATDPMGDDVIAGGFRIAEQGVEAPYFDRTPDAEMKQPLGRHRDVSACRVSGQGAPAWALLLLALGLRRRAGGRRSRPRAASRHECYLWLHATALPRPRCDRRARAVGRGQRRDSPRS